MKYADALKTLKALGCDLLTKEEFLERCRKEGEDVSNLAFSYGCENCGEAQGEDDFNDIQYAILGNYDDGTWSLLQELGVSYGVINYTIIARCKFCGACALYWEV